MMYPYMTLPDGTEITHSELLDDNRIYVHFERPTNTGFDSVRFVLPSYTMTSWEGHYSDKETADFVELLRHHAHLLYKYAANGGIQIA